MGSQNDFHELGLRIDLPPSPAIAGATQAMGTIDRTALFRAISSHQPPQV